MTPEQIANMTPAELNREMCRLAGYDLEHYDARGRYRGEYPEHAPTPRPLPDFVGHDVSAARTALTQLLN